MMFVERRKIYVHTWASKIRVGTRSIMAGGRLGSSFEAISILRKTNSIQVVVTHCWQHSKP